MRPENHGKLWTHTETLQLMKEIKLINMKDIATIHKRTENAIFLKLIREAAKLSLNDTELTLYDLSIITSLNISNLIQGFKKINYNKFMNDINDNDDNDDMNDMNDNNDDINDDNIDDNNHDIDCHHHYNYHYMIIPSIFIISLILFWKG